MIEHDRSADALHFPSGKNGVHFSDHPWMGTGILPQRMRHVESPDSAVIVCRKFATETAFSWHFPQRFRGIVCIFA
jgi:hypothetical protein